MTEAQRLADELREALTIGREAAYEVAQTHHASMAGYRQYEHDRLDADVKKIDAAIDRLASLIPAGGLAEEARDMTEQKLLEAWLPRDPAEVREFLSSHCRLLTYGEPSEPTIASENDTYELTAHDLLSAFVWAGHFDGDAAMAASPPQGQEKTR